MPVVSHQFNVYAAKSKFSELLARVEKGEEFVLARNGVPVARLGPLEPARAEPPRRVGGSLRGLISWEPGCFDPLSPEDQAEFEVPLSIGDNR